MARGRMIATSIALDPEFNAMSDLAQLCFLRAVPHLDKDGLIIGQPAALWATIAPLQQDWLPIMQNIIVEWERAGLVIIFDTKIGPVLYFDGFHKNQVGLRYDREPPSRLPIPDGYERTADGIRQTSGKVPADIRQTSGKVPQQVEVERKEKGNAPSPFDATSGAAPRESVAAAEYTKRAKALGLDARKFRQNVDALLEIVGKRALVDANPDDRDTTFILTDAKEAVLSLAQLGYDAPDVLRELADSWLTTNQWRHAPPTFRQLKEHASAVASGVQPKAQKATNGWAGLSSDIPEYMRD